MIKKRCFEINWIDTKRNNLNVDPILIEKAIYVFELLANLVENSVDLVFKVGTSLLPLIPGLIRLSIDLDIVTSESERKLERVFGEIAGKGLFTRWEEDQKSSKHEIPKKHFKFYYKSCLSNREEYRNAKEDASKIGCLASLLKDKRLDVDNDKIRKDRADIEKIRNIDLRERFAILNKLKSISPESFYLWAIALYGDSDVRSGA